MIFDCFLFHDEVELLEVRLMELREVVDWFVVVEGDLTISGEPKASTFAFERPRLEELSGAKFIHHRVELPLRAKTRMYREVLQRNGIHQALAEHAQWNDLVLISDIDEIPSAAAVMHARDGDAFAQRLFYWTYNCFMGWWTGTLAVNFSQLQRETPQQLRDRRILMPRLPDAGWHFSWLGTDDELRRKFESYSEEETDTDENKEALPERRARWESPWGSGDTGRVVPIDASFPYLVRLRQHALVSAGRIAT